MMQNYNAAHSSSLYLSNQKQRTGGSCLLIVDPQNDFVTGSLAVPGAVKDCKNIAKFIENNLDHLQEIYVTLDTHMNYHIAHPLFWKQAPPPFTEITHAEIKAGKYEPIDEDLTDWCLEYTARLEKQARLPGLEAFKLTIWPPHCLIGTEGHNVEPRIQQALQLWEKHNNSTVHYIIKGNNSKTEHYSAFRAEVLVEEDPATYFNELLFNDLKKHVKVYVGGEALSHCVNFTVRDLVKRLGDAAAKEKVVLLKGGMSSVAGCEAAGEKFWGDMVDKIGIKTVEAKKPIVALGFGLKKVEKCHLP